MLKQQGVSKLHEMESTKIKFQWLCFGGLSDEYPIWSTRFQAFSHIKGLFETLTVYNVPPDPSGRLLDGASDEQRAAHDAAAKAYMKTVTDIQKRNNTVWCYHAMVFDSTNLMLIRHDCVDNKGPGKGRNAWVLLQQKFRSDETVTVVSAIWQLGCLQLKKNDALHSYFIHAKELSTRLEHEGEHLSETLLNVMVLNGLSERYEHFVVQESFNPVGSFGELRTRLMKYEESQINRDYVDDVDSYLAMTSRKAKPKHKSSRKYNAAPISSSGQLTCYCCGMKSHMKSECYKRERAECTFGKQNGHLVQACMKKVPGTKLGSLSSSLKSDRALSEATEQN